MKRLSIAILFFGLWTTAALANFDLKVPQYQLYPDGHWAFLGYRYLSLGDDVLAAVPGIKSMSCKLYFHDDNLNGLPEAPMILSCLDAEGGEHHIIVEIGKMEGKSWNT